MSDAPVNAHRCAHCKRPIVWLAAIGRTVDRESVPYEDGVDGVIFDRRRGTIRHAADVHPTPQRCNPIHYCAEWYDKNQPHMNARTIRALNAVANQRER